MKSAGFCCIRALNQCAIDHEESYPDASRIVLNDFYVDDMMSGASSEVKAIQIYMQLMEMLGKGGFTLAKWSTNNKNVNKQINGISEIIDIDKEQTNAVLGMNWNSNTDTFQFKLKNPPKDSTVTKRKIVADVARLYDPIGYLAPAIVKAKMLIQDLWKSQINWDDEITDNLAERWYEFKSDLPSIESIKISRWLGSYPAVKLQLHAFSDASMRAYASVFYVRAEDKFGNVKVNLVFAKTRVAPVKNTLTIPKLELCAAHLSASIINEVRNAHNIDMDKCFLWSDSMIVMHWITKSPASLKTFIANRVSEIQEQTNNATWNHVKTKENPADIASRGMLPGEIVLNDLWWHGPSFLQQSKENWSPSKLCITKEELDVVEQEVKQPVVLASVIETEITCFSNAKGSILNQYDSFTRLNRVTAFILRFVKNARNKTRVKRTSILSHEDVLEISADEFIDAENYWIRYSQKNWFNDEVVALQNKINIDKKSSICKLTPFNDKDNVLRLSGRIKRSNMPYDTVHPVILSNKCRFAELLVKKAHITTDHGGIQLCQQYIRNKYWLLQSKMLCKQVISKCLTCFRQRKETQEQLIAHLPANRVRPGRAFEQTSVDYAGPVVLKRHNGRTRTVEKGYIAVFVCTKTHAVHLELVSDLTSDAFIAAFSRFSNRRGRIHELISDNATTFHGAHNEIKAIARSWRNAVKSDWFRNAMTKWTFLPPAAPHMGGLHEAAVKSAKHHLRRVIGTHQLTFEQLVTLLVHVEACLNSRPIIALTEEATDDMVLTPAHFLIGEPIISPIARDLTTTPENRLHKFKLIQKLGQEFWLRWSRECVTTKMKRYKWQQPKPNVKINDIVLVETDNLPPTQWPLGKIVQVYPDSDGYVRMVDVKFNGSVLQRPITKICVLPIDDNSNN